MISSYDSYLIDTNKIKYGLLIRFEVPHTLKTYPIVVEHGVPIVFNKPSKYTIRNDWNDEAFDIIKSSLYQIDMKWLNHRIFELINATSSMEECLWANSKANGVIDINTILNKHKIASPADVWPMWRKQANTPYSRFDLARIISERALKTKDDTLFDEVGKFVIGHGDLEMRPEWVNF